MTKAAPGLSAISSSFTSKPPLPLETANMGLFRLSLGPVPLAGEQWLWRLLVLRSVANNPAPDGLVTREWLHDHERDARHDVDALVRA